MRLATLIHTRLEHLRNERRTRAQIEARQLKKFPRLVAHAARHAPYYQEIIREHRIDVARCVPQDFPVLTKSMLRENFDRIVTDRTITQRGVSAFLEASKDAHELYLDRYYVVHTSGTSGEPGHFVYSPKEWSRGATGGLRVNVPEFAWRRLAFFGASQGHFTGVSLAVCVRRSLLRWVYDLAVYEINQPLEPTLDGLNAFRPTILMGYPSTLGILAERQLAGRLKIAPRYVQCSGEQVLAADRLRIERAFGVPLLNVYSSTEHLMMGLSRPEYDGMYLFEDDLIFELEPDHTLITNLFNHTMPLIRYRMSDVLMRRADDRGVLPFTKIEDLMGRNEHLPRFVNEHGEEDFLHPGMVEDFFVKNVRRFQLEVKSRTACRLRICLEPDLDDVEITRCRANVDQRFSEILAQKQMRNLRYDVEVVDDLPADPKTGKFVPIVPAKDDRAAEPWAIHP